MEAILQEISKRFNGHFGYIEKRPDIYQLFVPVYHEDGDMFEIYLERRNGNGTFRISDYAMTLMRLSYEFEIDTENKEKIYHKIVSENGIREEDGLLYLDTKKESLIPALMQFVQAVSKISSMRYFKREVLKSLFYDHLNDFIQKGLSRYRPRPKVLPLPERDDLEVDHELQGLRKPFYVFGVKDDAKARIVAISCLEFQRAKLPFKSLVVHENFEGLSKKDRSRITSAADKQFINIEDFKENGIPYLEREAA